MSSPFRYFRKHTKTFMAVAAVLCMFIFVIGGALDGGGRRDDMRDATSPVATWEGGSLNQGELASLVGQRLVVDEFLRRLFIEGGARNAYDVSVPPLMLPAQQRDQVEREVIVTEVIADMAEDAGLSVSDTLINHYLEELGSRNVGNEEMVAILRSVSPGNARGSQAVVFGMLRKMLLAHFYRRTYLDASQVMLPHERFEDWRRVNKRISLQAAVLPVDRFLSEVPEPTDAQLKALFDEFKNDPPNKFYSAGTRELPSPDPGFAEPRRVRLQFLLGSVAVRTEKWLDKVTEEEIADYYERNKRLEFIKMNLGGDEAPPSEGAPEDEGPAGKPAGEDASPEEPAAEEKPATEPPAESPSAEELGAEEPTDAPAEGDAPAAEETPPAAEQQGEETSSRGTASPFRLVAFQEPSSEVSAEEAAEEPAGEEPAEAPADESAPANSPAAAPAEAAPAEEAPAEQPPAGSNDAPAEPASDDEATEAESAEGDDAPGADEETVEYEPLEKVRDEIRRTIATEKAVDELSSLMTRAAAQAQTEYNRYGVKVAEAEAKKESRPKPPEKLTDMKWLADEYGLTAERTAPLTDRELFDTPVGKAADAATQTRSVTGAALTSLKLYEPFLAKDRDGDWYLVIKTEDKPKRVPEFKDVRDQVVEAWRHREAAKLAEKKAQELADEVEKASTSFSEFFASKGYVVIQQTSFFSWLEYPAGSMGTGTPPGLGDIPELSNIGPDFIRAAFKLEGDEAAGLLNFDKSTAYVIKLAKRQYTEEELREFFLEEANSWAGLGDMQMSHYSRFSAAMMQELEKRSDLQFDDEWEKRQAERANER